MGPRIAFWLGAGAPTERIWTPPTRPIPGLRGKEPWREAGGNAYVGNSPGFVDAFVGRIGFFGVWNRAMPLGEIVSHQWCPRKTSGCDALYHLGFNGVAAQPDWSGSGNTGTVTGATVSDHVPLSSPFGLRHGWRGAFTPAAAVVLPPRPTTVLQAVHRAFGY